MPGGQATYSDLAIEMVLMLRTVFHLALRQVEAFARSVLRLLGLDLRIPDHTTLSRRSSDFATRRPTVVAQAQHIIVDSTGLKLFGQGEWNEEKYGRHRRTWRKLHLAIDASAGEVVANALTGSDADDIGEVTGLLEQVDGDITSFVADGAYDGDPVYQAIARQQRDPPPDVVIPPRASAVLSADRQSQRDRHIRMIAEKGRMGWQKATGYGRRSLVGTTIGRYKHSIGSTLRARGLATQQSEVAIAV